MVYKKIKKNYVHKTAIIDWKNLIIGTNNIMGPYVAWGKPLNMKKNNGKIYIGNNNVSNEFVNIHRPTNKKKKNNIRQQ